MARFPFRLAAVLAALLPLPAFAHAVMDMTVSVNAPEYVRAGQTERIEVVAGVEAFDPAVAVVIQVETSAQFTGATTPSTWRCTREPKKLRCSVDELGQGPHPFSVDVAVPANGVVTTTASIVSIASDDPETDNNDHIATSRVYDASSCTAQAPAAIAGGLTQSGAVELSWSASAGATSYEVLAGVDGETPHVVATTTATRTALRLGGGEITWLVRAKFDSCPALEGASSTFLSNAPETRLAISSVTSEQFGRPVSVLFDRDFVMVADAERKAILSFYTGDEHVFELEFDSQGTPLAADGGLALGPGFWLYIADRGNELVRYAGLDFPRFVFPLAGSVRAAGSTDGPGASSRFRAPQSVAVDNRSRVFISDSGNHTIRRAAFDVARGEFSTATVAGAAGQSGFANGAGSSARFNDPAGIAVDAAGDLIIADRGNNAIRRLSTSGEVTTIAGVPGQAGHRDGAAAQALFNRPAGVALDEWGNILVTEEGNHTVRKIAPNGRVTTIAGQAGVAGDADGVGAAARFNGLAMLNVAPDGTVWIAEPGNGKVRRGTFVAAPGPKRRSVSSR